MSQIEEQPNRKLEEMLKKIISNKNNNLITDEEDAENNRPGPSNSEKNLLRRQHASNCENDLDKSQDNHFQPSDMNELRQPSISLGAANETLDETIISDGSRPEAEYYNNGENDWYQQN